MKNLLKISLVSLLGVAAAVSAVPHMAPRSGEQIENVKETVHEVRPTVSRYTDFNYTIPQEPNTNEFLYCNQQKDYTLKGNKVYTFKFNSLSQGLYVFEALSDAPTNLCIKSSCTGTIYDSEITGNKNARIQVELNEYTPVTVYVKMGNFSNNPTCETVTMSVKKKTISVVTRNFMDDMVLGAELNAYNTVINYHKDMATIREHYTVDVHTRVSTEGAISNDFYKDDVLAFWGDTFKEEGKINPYLYWDYGCVDFIDNYIDLEGTSLAIWGAIGSASDTSNYCPAKMANWRGAKCSIGIIDAPGLQDDFVYSFMCRLLNILSIPGMTVKEGVELTQTITSIDFPDWDANALNADDITRPDIDVDYTEEYLSLALEIWNETKPVRIYGDPNVVLVETSKTHGSFSLTNSNVGPITPRPGFFDMSDHMR